MTNPPQWNRRPVRWQARDERERKDMVEWTCAQLQAQLNAEISCVPVEGLEEAWQSQDLYRRFPDFDVQEAAYFGDIAPLRKRYPSLAEYLHLPPLSPGQKHPKPPKRGASEQALDTVQRIRKIWLEHFKKWKRHAYDGASAEEIAAEWLSVDSEEIEKRMKPSGKHKNRR